MLKNLARVAFNLTKALPLPKTSIYFKLQTRALYSFSTFDPKNIQKIMVGISVKDTEGILKDLESLDAKSKEFALMMIIESIERKEIPYQLLSEQKFQKQVQDYPASFINSLLILNRHFIEELAPLYLDFQKNEDSIADIITKINNNFVTCSSQYKKFEDKNELENYKFLVNRKYSDFYVSHLSRYYGDMDKLKTFQNCIETYRKHNQTFIQPVLKDGVLEMQKNPKNAIKIQEEMLSLVQLFAQNVLHLNLIAKQTFQITNDQEAYKKDCLTLKWEIGEVLSSYHQIRDIDSISLEYIEIRRVRAAINYFLRCYNNRVKGLGEEAHCEALKELKTDLDEVIKNSTLFIHKISGDPNFIGRITELSMTILAVKGYLLRRHQTPMDEQKRQLYELFDLILDGVTNKDVFQPLETRLRESINFIPHYGEVPNE